MIQDAALQFGDHQRDEILNAPTVDGRDDEAVAGTLPEPLFDLANAGGGDPCGRAVRLE